jgi:hypothetical protein
MSVCGASNSEVVDRFFGKLVHPLSKSYSITELRTGLIEFRASANVSGLAVEWCMSGGVITYSVGILPH